jgi:hypothetical protein
MGRPVSGRGAAVHGGTVIMASVVGAFSIHGVVVTGAGRAPASCLLGEGRLDPPSPHDVVWNSSVESSIMAHHGDGDPLWVEPMKVVPKLFLPGERLRPPN